MKTTKHLLTLLTTAGLFFGMAASAQNQTGIDSTGLPGDNFSLQGALEMFKKANSLEEFEKLINTGDNNINNLDLDGDGETDYIRVIDRSEKDVHAFVLQVPVSESESQDIAVIELEKTGNETAVIQIVGDEDIYGEEVIVEPDGGNDSAVATFVEDHQSGPSFGQELAPRIIVNVWSWRSVRFVYGGRYRPWTSPWRWRHYPGWWRPRRPLAWRFWHPRCVVYHRPFVVVKTHRVARARAIYRPARVSSVTVQRRNSVAMNHYRVTRTRTTVTGPRGNKAVKTTTTVKGRGGKVKARKTTVRRKKG